MNINLSALLAKHRWKIIAAACLLLFGYTMMTQMMPLAVEQVHMFAEIREQQDLIESAQKSGNNFTELQEQNRQLQGEIAQLVFHQSREVHLSKIIHFLDRAAREQGVQILSLKPQPISTFERHLELPIQMELTAQYHALGHFINDLETAAAIIRIDELKLTAAGMAESNLRVQMTMVVLYLKRE